MSGPFFDACVALGADHYWAGDEPSGTTIADLIGSDDVTLYGSRNAYQSMVTARTEAAVFDSAENNPTAQWPGTVNPVNGTDPFAVAVWLNMSAVAGSFVNIYNHRGPTNNHGVVFFLHTGDGRISFQLGDGTTIPGATAYVFAADTTIFAVGTYDGTNLRLYKDGALVAGPTAAPATPVAGTDPAGQNYVEGASFPVATFKNVTLSGTDVADLYAAGIGPGPPLGTVMRSGMRLG